MNTPSALRMMGLVSLACLSAAASGCSDDTTTTPTTTTRGDIVETAVGAGSFKTLVAALGAADLVSTLKGPGPFTVFAPNDDAFAKLPAGTVETLLKPENVSQLKNILLFHVVAGRVMAADVVKLNSAKTVQGQDVPVMVSGAEVRIGSARVLQTDIQASNGVIHAVDSVLLPAVN